MDISDRSDNRIIPSEVSFHHSQAGSFEEIPIRLEPLSQENVVARLITDDCPDNYTTQLLNACLALPKHTQVDFGDIQKGLQKDLISIKAGIPLSSWQVNNDKSLKSAMATADTCIKNQLTNKLKYVNQILNNIKKDMPKLDEFGLNEKNIKNIQIVFSNGDCHNGGKSPVFLKFTVETNGQEGVVRLVYKPRSTLFDQAIHNSNQSLFQKISSATGQQFATYRIVSIADDDEPHGYCEFIEGNQVYNEETEIGFPEFVSKNLDFSLFKDRWNEAGQADNPMEARQNLSKDNYFYARTAEQLGRDFLFFTVLSEIGAGDTHGANFIDKEHGLLHFIDAECFDDTRYTNSADALFLIETAYIAHGWDKPDVSSFMQTIQPLVAEFNEFKKNQPMRYVPLDTQNFYDMRDKFIACGGMDVASLIGGLREALADPNAERQFQIIGEKEGEFNFDETALERQLTVCFRDFDIPIFVIHGDTISMNGVPVAKETTTIKKEDGR